ncbi:hypothetical protein DACRYDRAFT_53670 [Dacryopinax primogenitus]|uniref:Uncharacterized protein n=1 Tax=Dacryopinax primogenitus (strain DJM 731) TaxID=1858805 RepID=M5GAY0_DACPD|nr:uncharacterized protein DACRYDRAFT_53670 [Dacryopinax primogenitus]EJU01098.1 hypothetical protein DACRYDRAFT_53670 [Dacryopinax primogenitus]
MFATRVRRFAEGTQAPLPSSTPGSTAPRPPSKRTLPYMQFLTNLSQRTGAPLPSLIVSFGVLHELTAVFPLFGFFFASRWLGVGQSTVEWATRGEGWGGELMRRWVREGGESAERIGGRYGWFGYEKLDREGRRRLKDEQKIRRESSDKAEQLGEWIAGDVANVVLAYGLTKAILPVRIGLSLYLSPWFSRSAVEPIRKSVWRIFSRKDRPV